MLVPTDVVRVRLMFLESGGTRQMSDLLRNGHLVVFGALVRLTLKDMGGADSIHWSGDRLPFLTGSYYGHQIS